jgi:hypothetical protein
MSNTDPTNKLGEWVLAPITSNFIFCLYQVRKVQECQFYLWYYDFAIIFWNCFANVVFFAFYFIGPPIITHRNMSLINGKVVLSIYVFSDPRITDVVWMRKISGKTTDNGSPKNAMESIRNATVTTLSYGVRVSVHGQRIKFNIVELNVTKGRYVCQIRNDHELKEVSYNMVEIASLLDSYNRPAITG